MSRFAALAQSNLKALFSAAFPPLAENLPAEPLGSGFHFRAFGQGCLIGPDGIFLDHPSASGVPELLVSIYALNSRSDAARLTPFKAFRELPNSGPYVVAFISHTESILAPQVESIHQQGDRLASLLDGRLESPAGSGDFAFILWPLPKIALHYIFYRADEEFPATVSCLFSNNAAAFLPTDALADVAEVTSRRMLDLLQ
jgi:hypothetical protein